jgi:peroxin-5
MGNLFIERNESWLASLWDQDFLQANLPKSEQTRALDEELAGSQTSRDATDADALSRTAGSLVETLRHEQNPKFRSSEFMRLMRSLRDKTLVVEGTDFVAGQGSASGSTLPHGEIVDVKGKGKEVADISVASTTQHARLFGMTTSTLNSQQGYAESSSMDQIHHVVTDEQSRGEGDVSSSSEDEVFEYFRQVNEDYIKYHNEQYNQPSSSVSGTWDNTAEWAKLQSDWDSFEATATGIQPISNYPFTPNNPYLLGERSEWTSNHARHSYEAHEVRHLFWACPSFFQFAFSRRACWSWKQLYNVSLPMQEHGLHSG